MIEILFSQQIMKLNKNLKNVWYYWFLSIGRKRDFFPDTLLNHSLKKCLNIKVKNNFLQAIQTGP